MVPKLHKAAVQREQEAARELLAGDVRDFWSNVAVIDYRDPGHFHWLYKANFGRVPGNDARFLENLTEDASRHGPSYIVQFVTASSPFPPLMGGKLCTEGRVAFEMTRSALADLKGAPEGGAFFAASDAYLNFMNRIYALRTSLFNAKEDLLRDCADGNAPDIIGKVIDGIPVEDDKRDEVANFLVAATEKDNNNIENFLWNEIENVKTAVKALNVAMETRETAVLQGRKLYHEHKEETFKKKREDAQKKAKEAEEALRDAEAAKEMLTKAREKGDIDLYNP